MRHYLILVGFVCQGLACERWAVAVAYALVWYGALRFRQPRRRLSEDLEVLIMFGALVAAFRLAPVLNVVWFASVGNALVLFQFFRLLWPLEHRQKYYTVAVAITQIAVGAQVVFNYSFVLILIASLLLIPAALAELERQRVSGTGTPFATLPGRAETGGLAALMVAFFLFFPRQQLAPATATFALRAGRPRPDLDMRTGGREVGEQMIFRIEGKAIGYLRCFSLDTFDGAKWTASPKSRQARGRAFTGQPAKGRHRRVKLMQPAVLRTILPVDGVVMDLRGNQMQRPYVAEHGGVFVPRALRWPITYDYWSVPGPLKEALPAAQRQRYLALPTVSPAVRQWAAETVGDATQPRQQAQRLMARLRTFTYEIGAPTLNRASPLEEFLLTAQTGHCERFASALAALLRLRGIPARVVVGYLPVEENAFGGFYNIRARHGHAWTEAWFEGVGWECMDATPVGVSLPVERRQLALTVYEWVEFVWYAKIVEFGFSEQLHVITGLTALARRALQTAYDNWGSLLATLGAGIAVVLGLRWCRGRRGYRDTRAMNERQLAVRHAAHFYARMLRLLARRRFRRLASQTPLEFLAELEARSHPRIDDIRCVTTRFCAVAYGRATLSAAEMRDVRDALRRLGRAAAKRSHGRGGWRFIHHSLRGGGSGRTKSPTENSQ